MIQKRYRVIYSILLTILISSFLYYFSTGLYGNCWYFLWVAPVPVLFYSYFNPKTSVFFVAFVAYLLSQTNVVFYYMKVTSSVLGILFVILSSLIFAIVILLNKIIVSKLQYSNGIFVFPILYVSFEFVLSRILPDGTFGSIAYSQANSIYLIQIASITGIYGITFVVSLFASLITFILISKNKTVKYSSFIIPVLILLFVFIFGIQRINYSAITEKEERYMNIFCLGINALSSHTNINNPQNRDIVLNRYKEIIGNNNFSNIDCILLPEKIAVLEPGKKSEYYNVLLSLAKTKESIIIAGWTINYTQKQNIATVFFPDGKTFLEYQKRFLVSGWERNFTKGNSILKFDYKNIKYGVAICKDMDFPDWIRKYSSSDILFVPAWDFQADNWLHSRMAVLRGIENGNIVIRSAKEGNITISNPFGQIISEKVYNKDSNETSLLSKIKITNVSTIYSKYGNWFNWTNLLICILLLLYIVSRKIMIIKKVVS